jgi:hypothetical protein
MHASGSVQTALSHTSMGETGDHAYLASTAGDNVSSSGSGRSSVAVVTSGLGGTETARSALLRDHN